MTRKDLGVVELAATLQEQGDFRRAIDILDGLILPADRPAEISSELSVKFALAYLAADRDIDAEKWLIRALVANPRSSRARKLLAFVYLRSSRAECSLVELQRGLAADQNDAEIHFLIAESLFALGRLDEAADAYSASLDLRPAFPEALCNFGCLLRVQGKSATAIEVLEKAVALKPDFVTALSALALALHDCNRAVDAASIVKRAIQIDPSCSDLYLNLGQIIRSLPAGTEDEALALTCKALVLKADSPAALNNLGAIYEGRGEFLIARSIYERVLRLCPDYPDALLNLGNTYEAFDDHSVARDYYLRAVSASPLCKAEYFHNIGLTYQRQGEIVLALGYYDRAIEVDPGFLDSCWNRALCLFYLGRFDEGWIAHECRLDSSKYRKLCVEPGLPVWDGGASIGSRPLLVVAEQGLGDALQFVRFAPCLLERGITVSLCVPEPLIDLFRSSGLASAIVSPATLSTEDHDFFVPMMSLPLHLGLDVGRPLGNGSYLEVDQERQAYWRSRLLAEKRPIVAVNWQGNPATEVSTLRGRSFPLEMLRPLVEAFDLRLVSLQKGPGSEQLSQCSFRDCFVDCQPEIEEAWDFRETAAILSCCDLVITSDTAPAHLAGAIGVPTWLLLHHIPDWRWGLEGDQTFWYPSMRLFRQRTEGNWAGVIQQVINAMGNDLGYAKKSVSPKRFMSSFWAWVEQGSEAPSENPDVAAPVVLAAAQKVASHPTRANMIGSTLSNFWRWLEDSERQPSVPGSSDVRQDDDLLPPSLPGLPDLQLIRRELARQCINWRCLPIARRLYQELLASGSSDADVYDGLGAVALLEQKDQEALELLSKANTLRPDHPDTLHNLGTVHYRLGEISQAHALLERAITLRPNFADAHCNLAVLHHDRGDIAQSIAGCERALELDPGNVKARWQLAHSLLLVGDFQRGWIEHEWRLLDRPEKKLHAMPYTQRLECCADVLEIHTPLLVVSEQGVGDTLHFLRYIRTLRARGLDISLCVPERLHRLVICAFPDLPVLNPDQGRTWDSGPWLSLMSLPGVFQDSPSCPVVTDPYLKADGARVDFWREHLLGVRESLVALNWQGNPAAEIGPLKGRSLPLEEFSPLASVSGIRLVSLQKGFGSDQLATCSFRDRFIQAQDLVDDSWDFLETAAILANCDLLITSDTALAHLAGAMGRPTWLLLHHIPDWRWGLEGASTFWYPSMRLFRQERPGDWSDPIRRVTEALEQWRRDRSA